MVDSQRTGETGTDEQGDERIVDRMEQSVRLPTCPPACLVIAHSKIGASFASTSSMVDAGKVSTLRPLRAPRSSTRG